jgi:hypothetical protein
MEEPLKRLAAPAGHEGGARKRGRAAAKLRSTAAAPVVVEPAAPAREIAREAASLVPSAAIIGLGVLLESELLVGIAIGTAMVLVSRWLPEAVAGTVRPIINGTVSACYSAAAKTGEMVGEAVERVESIITHRGQAEEEASAAAEGSA